MPITINLSTNAENDEYTHTNDTQPHRPQPAPLNISKIYQSVVSTSSNHHLGLALSSIYSSNLASRTIPSNTHPTYQYISANLQSLVNSQFPSTPLFTIHASDSNPANQTFNPDTMSIPLDNMGMNTLLSFDPSREHVWRSSLREGMLIDCLDSTSSWYIAN